MRSKLTSGRFGRVQLLVILAVVVILSIVLFPLYAPRRGARPVTRCLSNVKHLAGAMILYSQDNDGRFPLRDNWMDSTGSYRRPRVVRCVIFADDRDSPRNQYGYAMNQAMSGAKEPANSGTVPLVFDSINLARNASGTLDSLPNPPRHEEYNNIGYADGHARRVGPN
jgi:prepilin-type processing-associated H-X9-DG protein